MDLSLTRDTAKLGGAMQMLNMVVAAVLVRSPDAEAILASVPDISQQLFAAAAKTTNTEEQAVYIGAGHGANAILEELKQLVAQRKV